MNTITELDLISMTDDELRDLASAISAEMDRRLAEPHQHTRDCYDDAGPGAGGVSLICGKTAGPPVPPQATVRLSTDNSFDPRKHGHAYVAVLTMGEGRKVNREFVQGGSRRWDTKRKTYSQDWEFTVPVGTVLECRLTDGSWKNDYRVWYVVNPASEGSEDGLESISQSAAHALLS